MRNGILYQHPLPDTLSFSVGYVVTAKHNIRKIKDRATFDGKVVIRCNRKNDGATEIDTNVSDWREHPSSTADVAAMPLTMPGHDWDHKYLWSSNNVTADVIQKEGITLGDEVFLVGLFVRHSGTQRNIPIVRVGNIASMPEEPVQTKDFGLLDAYLVEARSIGGLSGSPVFVHLPGVRMVGSSLEVGRIPKYYLLGLMHGHWDMPHMTIDDFGDSEGVNTGIAVVVPSEKIAEMLNIPEFRDDRERKKLALDAQHSATPGGEPPGWNLGLVVTPQ